MPTDRPEVINNAMPQIAGLKPKGLVKATVEASAKKQQQKEIEE
jgi:hypothetical protein